MTSIVGATPGLRVDGNRAALVADDAVHDGEAEPRAFGEAAVERLEDAIELLGRDADAVVAHREHDGRAADAGGIALPLTPT